MISDLITNQSGKKQMNEYRNVEQYYPMELVNSVLKSVYKNRYIIKKWPQSFFLSPCKMRAQWNPQRPCVVRWKFTDGLLFSTCLFNRRRRHRRHVFHCKIFETKG